jgi:hypothetical protein
MSGGRRVSRYLWPLVIGLALVAIAVPSPMLAGVGATGTLVFRVRLEGPVPATHSFGVLHECGDQGCFTDRIGMACSPPPVGPGFTHPTCMARTYELVYELEVGSQVAYSLVRWTDADLGTQPEELLPGSWTVQEGRQVISLGYVYPSTGTGSGPGGSTLPDTAVDHVTPAPSAAGWILVSTAVAMAARHRQRRRAPA